MGVQRVALPLINTIATTMPAIGTTAMIRLRVWMASSMLGRRGDHHLGLVGVVDV